MDEYDEYNDAADDWEMEAEEEQLREQQVEEERARMKDKDRPKRAPIVKKVEVEVEETVVEADVEAARGEMRQKAQELASAMGDIAQDSAVDLIADMPLSTPEEAEAIGAAIASRTLEFSEDKNFAVMMKVILGNMAQELGKMAVLQAVSSDVSRARGRAKRTRKDKTKAGGGAAKKQGTQETDSNDGNDLDLHVTDRGGAAGVDDSEQMF